MEIIINKEYIESHLGRKITQDEANHIISKIGDNDGLWEILHDSIDYASEAYDEDEQHLRELQEQGLNGYDKIESEVINA